MSTDWNVYCLDCASELKIDNGRADVAATLSRHAGAIADLSAESVALQFVGTHLDVAWFERHRGHRLAPINEYGELLGQCTERVACGCGGSAICSRDARHEGPHDPTSRQNKERGGPRAVTADQTAALLDLLRVAEEWALEVSSNREMVDAIRKAGTAMGSSS